MKKLFAVFLCIVMAFGCMTIAFADSESLADEVSTPTRMSYTNMAETISAISNGNVTSFGSITGYPGITTKVTISLTLQRRVTNTLLWSYYRFGPTRIFNSYRGSTEMTHAVERGYQYRTKATFTAYSGSNSETFTLFSNIVGYW